MPVVTMPDGSQVDMPDNLPPELGQRLRTFNTFQQLGASNKPDQPGYTFFPNGVTYRHADQKLWVPAANSWFSYGDTGLQSEGKAQLPDTQEARDQAQTALEIGKVVPRKSQPIQPAPSQTPYVAMTPGGVLAPVIPGNAPSEVVGQIAEAPAIAGASLMRGIAGLSEYARSMAQRHPILARLEGISPEVAQAPLHPSVTKAAELSSEFLKSRTPTTTAGEVANIGAQAIMAPIKYGAAGPAAPVVIGGESLGNTYLDAKQAGASEDRAIHAAGASGAVQGLVALGIPFVKAQGVVGSVLKGATVGAAMHGGQAAATALYSPDSAKKMVTDPAAWAKAVLPMVATEAAIGGHYAPETPGKTGEPAPVEHTPRTPDQIRAEAVEAARNGDIAKMKALKQELASVEPEETGFQMGQRPAFRQAHPEEAAKAGKYAPLELGLGETEALQEAMRAAPEKAAPFRAPEIKPELTTEDAAKLNDLMAQRVKLGTDLDEATSRAARTKSKKALAQVDDLTQQQNALENEIAKIQLGIKEPETGPSLPVVESTEYQGKRQGSLMGPNDEQLVARDPETGNDIGRLWLTKTDNGFEVRKVETDPNYQRMGVATKLYKEAASKYGPYAGSTDQTEAGKAFVDSLRQTSPEVFEKPTGELTPGVSGTETLSNEEIQRAQRGDRYYRIDRSGNVTNLGPQPDAPVRDGEAIIMVSGQTGKPQVQNSQGLGTDQAVLGKFGNKVMQVHESGRGMIADNLGLQQLYEAGMGKAKDALGLDRNATDGDVVRAVGEKIGKLGSSIKETAIRIMNQIKGIGRDLANAIAEHLHNAVSGTRESQRGAIGEKPQYSPEEEAHYQSHIKEARDLISEFLPGDENRAARSQAYRNLPSKASVISDYRRANAPAAPAPEPAPKYNRLEGFAKSAVQPLVDAPKVARAIATGGNEATNKVWNLLQERDVLPKEYEQGSLETPKIVRPLIFGEDRPKITKDFKQNILGSGAKATFDRFMRSPHNLEEGVFGKYNTPTQDLQMAVVSAMHNRNNLSSYFRDLLRTTDVKDNSVEMQAEAKPLFERFQKVASELDPIQKQREALEKNLKSAEKKGDPTSARQALSDWDAQNGQRYAEAQAQMDSIQSAHQKMLRDFASKYGDARVALAAEYAPDKIPAWIKLYPEEKTAADGMRNTMRSIKGQLERVGIPTREEDYVTHLTKYLAPETGGSIDRRTPREILKFAPRAEDSTQWLPSVHAAVSDYIPNVTRKLATQEFYNKWRSMIDDKDPNSLSNPASPNYAPNASIYLKDMFKTLDSPDSINFFDKAVNKLRDYENMKLLAANIRVGWKHAAGKLPSILAQHDVWTAPGALGQAKAMVGKLSDSNPIRTAVDRLGGNTVDWAKKADLVSYFANTREILGMLRENPFTSGVEEVRRLGPGGASSNKVIRAIFGDRSQDALARINRGIQKITSNPVAAVEAWENGLDLLTSIEKGHAKGLGDEQNVKAFLNNILDFNFRGGADSPRLIKDPKTRYFVQFAQTPMKLAELKAKLIMNAVRGGKDIYGTDHTANLVKHVAMVGLAFGVAKQMGVNVKDSILHLPFLNSDQWGRMAKMAYYGTKANLLNDPKARRQFNDTKAAFIGEKMPAVMGSPVFDIMRDVETGLSTGPSGIIKQMPIYNQMKAILTDKPPKGFDNVGAYLTGERSERSKKQMEQRAIQAGRRQIRYEQKLERSR